MSIYVVTAAFLFNFGLITKQTPLVMLKKYLKFNILFAVIFIIQLTVDFNGQLSTLKLINKPLITIALMVMLCISTGLKGRFHKRILAGLIFALAGDVFLMLNGQNHNYFTYGLLAFLICHLCYIRAFYLDFSSAPELDKTGARIAIIVCGIITISFYFYIRPYLGSFKLPVLAYVIIISLMLMMAAFRNKRVNKLSFNLILLGAIFFILSDGTLAYNKFVKPFNASGMVIMSTYMLAQYLITIGAIERKLIKREEA